MLAADDGISPLTVQSAPLPPELKVSCTWYMGIAPRKIYIECDKSKEHVRKSRKVLCAWDSGSVTVMVTDPLTHTQAGTQCPGSTLKKYHPHRHNVLYYHGCIMGSLK